MQNQLKLAGKTTQKGSKEVRKVKGIRMFSSLSWGAEGNR
jgi:hypothetical protein